MSPFLNLTWVKQEFFNANAPNLTCPEEPWDVYGAAGQMEAQTIFAFLREKSGDSTASPRGLRGGERLARTPWRAIHHLSRHRATSAQPGLSGHYHHQPHSPATHTRTLMSMGT